MLKIIFIGGQESDDRFLDDGGSSVNVDSNSSGYAFGSFSEPTIFAG